MKRWVIPGVLLLGVVLGAAAAVLAPDRLTGYLPEGWRGKKERVEGTVVRKQREPDRLLLTIVSDRGALLATFTRRLPELDLLIEQNDQVTIALGEYRPFVEDPVIERVQKAEQSRATEETGPPTATTPGQPPAPGAGSQAPPGPGSPGSGVGSR